MEEPDFRSWLKKDNPKATVRMITDCVKRIRRIEEVHGNIDKSFVTVANVIAGLNFGNRKHLPFGRGQKAVNALKTALTNYVNFSKQNNKLK